MVAMLMFNQQDGMRVLMISTCADHERGRQWQGAAVLQAAWLV